MGRKAARQPTATETRTPIPAFASLKVSPERIERMWRMTAKQRVEAAQQGQFTLGEMLQWASRRPAEVPLVENEFWFITAFSADADAETADDAQGFWEGEYTPMPDTRDTSRTAPGGRRRQVEREEPVMRVLIAETDQQLARERARQLEMNGHHTSLALAGHGAALKLAELPDALVLCNLGSPVQTIRLRARSAPGRSRAATRACRSSSSAPTTSTTRSAARCKRLLTLPH